MFESSSLVGERRCDEAGTPQFPPFLAFDKAAKEALPTLATTNRGLLPAINSEAWFSNNSMLVSS